MKSKYLIYLAIQSLEIEEQQGKPPNKGSIVPAFSTSS
jgi:hypothetical protein